MVIFIDFAFNFYFPLFYVPAREGGGYATTEDPDNWENVIIAARRMWGKCSLYCWLQKLYLCKDNLLFTKHV